VAVDLLIRAEHRLEQSTSGSRCSLVGRKRLWRIVLRKIGALKFFLDLKPELYFAAFRFAILFPELVRAISNLLVCGCAIAILTQINVASCFFLYDYHLPDVWLMLPELLGG
jgi:hypothetical protein